mmetsp:Transcript_7057/g.21539  ORF Transcript_7057/g.21539 Transcript_7057/m.21539 type:complete len:97 (-) Transcript_7057:686-976(-)
MGQVMNTCCGDMDKDVLTSGHRVGGGNEVNPATGAPVASVEQEDHEVKRQKMLRAAEARKEKFENRGVPNAVRRTAGTSGTVRKDTDGPDVNDWLN